MPDAAEHLAAQRLALLEEVALLEASHAAVVGSRDAASGDDEHDPDGATVGFEQAQVAGLLARARERLAAVDLAEARVAAGTYGRCERCSGPIGRERLDALPETGLCAPCARAPRVGIGRSDPRR